MISISSKESSSFDDPFVSSSSKAVRVKMEEQENGIGIFGGSPVASSSKVRCTHDDIVIPILIHAVPDYFKRPANSATVAERS
jgi:hypothetical protein